MNLLRTPYLASIDVQSLFIHISLNKILEITCNTIFDNQIPLHYMSAAELKQILSLACKESYFIFNDLLYQQTYGVSIVSSLGPPLLIVYQRQTLGKSLLPHSLSHCTTVDSRYVDDTFAVFSDASHAQLFLDYLNTKHNNIKFTIEPQENNTLFFLDTNISVIDNTIGWLSF